MFLIYFVVVLLNLNLLFLFSYCAVLSTVAPVFPSWDHSSAGVSLELFLLGSLINILWMYSSTEQKGL